MYRLREIEKSDLAEINQWRNNPDIISNLGASFRFINLDIDCRWYENYINNRRECIRCAITFANDDKILGMVSLTSIDYINQSAKLHIQVGRKENQGKGIGTYAVREMLLHAFDNMNLRRVELTVLSDNRIAKHLYEKCGFVLEGCKKSAIYKKGKFVDIDCYAVLREKYYS